MRLLAYFANGFLIGIAASQGNWLALAGWVAATLYMSADMAKQEEG